MKYFKLLFSAVIVFILIKGYNDNRRLHSLLNTHFSNEDFNQTIFHSQDHDTIAIVAKVGDTNLHLRVWVDKIK